MSTIAEVARHLFMDERRAKELIAAGTITKADRGAYHLDAVREEYVLHLREIAAGRTATGEFDGAQEKARKDREQADHWAMRNEQMRGELVATSDVIALMGATATVIRTKLLGLTGKLGPRLEPTARDLVDREINEALTQLAEPKSIEGVLELVDRQLNGAPVKKAVKAKKEGVNSAPKHRQFSAR